MGKSLVDRRALLRGGLFSAGIAGASLSIAQAQESIGANAPAWMKTPGRTFSAYGEPAKAQEKVPRIFAAGGAGRAGTGPSRTPILLLEGTITPNGLHFERNQNRIPDIDPARHELVIHGMVT